MSSASHALDEATCPFPQKRKALLGDAKTTLLGKARTLHALSEATSPLLEKKNAMLGSAKAAPLGEASVRGEAKLALSQAKQKATKAKPKAPQPKGIISSLPKSLCWTGWDQSTQT